MTKNIIITVNVNVHISDCGRAMQVLITILEL